jgi:hypothetical protein
MKTKLAKRLSTVKNLPGHYPDAGFTESSIRWFIFNAHENGFTQCVRRAGRKVLIDLDAFENWMGDEALQGGDR